MKPTFALNLSNERVGLLHRTGRGWLQVGEVAFDTPDLTEALAYLRKTALGLSPRGVSTKLVIPNTEILYCDVEAPGPDDETRRTQIRDGLAGRTPYAPEDLVFDWRGKGTMVKVAVVARQTLAEAEAFATEHRFGPVSFVALPDPSQFKGEPFFGATEGSKTILTKGDMVEPEREVMTIVTRDLPLADTPPEPEDRAAKRSGRGESPDADPIAASVEKMRGAVQPTPKPDVMPAPEAAAKAADPAPEPTPAALPSIEAAPAVAPKPPATPPDQFRAPAFEKQMAVSMPVIDEAPFAEVIDPLPAPTDRRDAVVDDVPPAPSAAATLAFNSRRAADEAPRTATADPRPVRERSFGDLPGTLRPDPSPRRSIPPIRTDANVTAASIPGSKKRKVGTSTPPPAVAAAAAALASSGSSLGLPTKPLTRPGGTFGAKPLPRKGKPRYLGLILTGLLLVVLALIAAWSSYSLVRNDTDIQNQGTALATNDAGLDSVPAVEDEMLADQQDTITPSDIGETAEANTVETAAADPVAQTVPVAEDIAVATASAPAETSAASELPLNTELSAPLDETVADLPAPDPSPVTRGPVATTAELTANDATPAETPAEIDVATSQDLAAVAGPSVTAPDEAEVAAADTAIEVPAAPPAATDDVTVAGSEASASEPVPVAPVEAEVAAAEPAAAPVPAPAPDLGLATTASGLEPRATDPPPDEIFLATTDTAPSFQDALQLPDPAFPVDALPVASPPPPAFGTVYQFDEAGLIRPTQDGILSPDGFMLFAGAPPLTPPERSPVAIAAATAAAAPAAAIDPEAEAAAGAAAASLAAPSATAPAPAAAVPAPADPAMAGFRPRPRPEGLTPAPAAAENADDASLSPEAATREVLLRPRTRPATLVVAGAAARNDTAAASLTAQANAAVEAALASAAETGNVMTLAVSRRPAARPQDMSRAVNAAVAAAVRAPEPSPEPQPAVASNDAAIAEDDAEPELVSAAPRIPTKTTVAKQATFANAINLSKINLIGVYGTSSRRYALVRLASGRYKKVSVGDSVDGGRVEAITASEVRYQKSGRLVSLKMPRT